MAIANRCDTCGKIGLEGGSDCFRLDLIMQREICDTCYAKLPFMYRCKNSFLGLSVVRFILRKLICTTA